MKMKGVKKSTGTARKDIPVPRTIDDYLETAQHSTHIENGSKFAASYRYWFIFLSLGVANSSDASEILCLSYTLSQSNFESNILLDSAWRGGILASAVFLGMFFGGLLVGGGWSDWCGRRPILLGGLAMNAIAGVASSLSWDVWSLSFVRFVAGIGVGTTVPPLFALCSELAPPADRGFWVTVAASFWMVGSIYVAVAGWIILGFFGDGDNGGNWRSFMVVCAFPSALGSLLVYKLVPESPRFLALQGRYAEALESVERLVREMGYRRSSSAEQATETTALVAGSDSPLLTVEELKHHYPLRSGHNLSSKGTGVDEKASAGFLKWVMEGSWDFVVSSGQLYTPVLLRATLSLQIVWFALSFGSYGLTTWINTLFVEVHLENVYWNALLFALSNLPGNILSAYFLDRKDSLFGGRNHFLIASLLLAALSLAVFAAAAEWRDKPHKDHSDAQLTASLIVVAACAFQASTICCWNAIDILTSELFPTTVRSTGMGVCAATGRLAALLAQLVNSSLVSRPAVLLSVAAFTLLIGAVAPATIFPADMTGQPVADDLVGQKGNNSMQERSLIAVQDEERTTADPTKANPFLPFMKGFFS